MELWGSPALTNVISEQHFFKTPPSGLNADRLTTISQIGPNPFSSYTLHTSQLKFSSKVSREEPCQTLFPGQKNIADVDSAVSSASAILLVITKIALTFDLSCTKPDWFSNKKSL
ncbi:hypothetical protein J6590_100450 [Homalodisca vitripennis]|nr:hypothetical protein J6590_100450 [Homalodisca vitripennis]